ncbi:MAG: di-trans,poly-cis-decaprenylcistransferase [Oscillospiraceae bacterium]|nr:di-trans,poly-cis-decaprenylcistransferase [Oscillospiraceae bacterium]
MRIPRHIGIIPDGNRRWASSKGLNKQDGYKFGLNPGLQLLELAKEQGVEEITYYGFTTDNCKRPQAQFSAFSNACVTAVEIIAQHPVSLLVVGNSASQMFPEQLKKFTTRQHLNGGGMKVNFLVNYGWEWDMSELSLNTTNRNEILNSLMSHDISRIDLIIRWGGMRRLSGFLPVQSVYADFYVVDSLWPDFSQNDFFAALDWYQKQDITLGG